MANPTGSVSSPNDLTSPPKEKSILLNPPSQPSQPSTVIQPTIFFVLNWKILTNFSILLLQLPLVFDHQTTCNESGTEHFLDMKRADLNCGKKLTFFAAPIRTCLILINIVLVLVPLLALRTQRGFLMMLKTAGFKDLLNDDKIRLFNDHSSIYSVLLFGHLLCNLFLGSLAFGLMSVFFWMLKNKLDVDFTEQLFYCYLNDSDSNQTKFVCTNNLIYLSLFMLTGYLVFLVFNSILFLRYLPIRKTRAEAVLEFFGKGICKKPVG